MAKTTFAGPLHSTGGFVGNVTGDVTGGVNANKPLKLRSYTVAGLPSAANNKGSLIFVSNAGTAGEAAWSDGTDWISMVSGEAVAEGA